MPVILAGNTEQKKKSQAKIVYIWTSVVGKIINERCIPSGMPTLKKKKKKTTIYIQDTVFKACLCDHFICS